MSLPSSGSTAPTITSPLLAWPSLPKSRSPLSTPPSSASLYDNAIPAIYSRHPNISSRSLASSLTASESWNFGPVPGVKGRGKSVREADFEDGPESQPPNSSRSLASSATAFESWNLGSVSDLRGKGKAVPEAEKEYEDRPERKYAPPKAPLTPHQLSRIAQSFGIVVPSLPPPSPSPSPAAGPSRLRLDPPSRASPFLLTVIPPLSLLSLKSITGDEADKRTRKWKRGRLIPLQPTLAGMLVAIAREFGLPNTTGLQVYMGTANHSSASSAASFSSEDPTGPQISPQSWSTLFGAHLSGTPSRSSTPSQTPVKSSGPLGRDIAFPLSPLSLVEKKLEHARSQQHNRLKQPFAHEPPLSAPVPSLVTHFPPTPPATASLAPNPIIGTIEFDLDPDLATWFPEYRRSGRYRKSSTSSESGIRPLRLPRQLSASPAFLRKSQSRTQTLRDSDGFEFGSGETTLNDHDDFDGAFLPLQSRAAEGRRLSVKRAESRGGMRSTAGSFGDLEADTSFSRSSAEESRPVPEIMLHSRAASGEVFAAEEEDLLASPIALDGLLAPVERVRDGDDKRGSAMVMSEQLDDLERIMRQLSPRDIRLTSPRMLTPRMAAKVATSHLQFPVDPKAVRKPTSSLARDPVMANASTSSLPMTIPTANTSTLTVNTIATQSSVPSFDATTLSRPPLEAEYTDAGLPIPTWPAVPFAKLSESPGSPGSIHDYFRSQQISNAPPSPISPETLMRMKLPSPPEMAAKAPRRPNRPPSPDLSGSSIPHHSLPSEFVDQINRSPATPDSPARMKSRSGSISLKGLKHMGSRNFGWKRSDHDKQPPPALPLVPRREEHDDEGRPVGLFGMDKMSPKESAFPSVGRSVSGSAVPVASEFGQMPMPDTAQAATLPSKGKDSSFSRWNPFGSKKNHNPPDSPKSTAQDRSSKASKRHPSIDHRTIGSPVSGSFTRAHQHSPSFSSINSRGRPSLPELSSSATTHTLASEDDATGPTSPRSYGSGPVSPRSVKRKPVPPPLDQMPMYRNSEDDVRGRGMKGSLSMGSVASFGVDEKRSAVGLGVRVG